MTARTKARSKDEGLDEAAQALASAAENNPAALAKAMESAMAAQGLTLQDLVSMFGDLKVVAAGQVRAGTRAAKRDEWALATELVGDDREAVESLPEVLASTPIPQEERSLDQSEIDALAHEVKPLRRSEDIIKGRIAAIKAAVFRHFDASFGQAEPGRVDEVKSPVNGVKLSRQVTVRRPSEPYDVEVLEQELERKTFLAITTERRVFDPEKLARLMDQGKIGDAERVALWKAANPSTVVEAFYVRDLKPGEDVDV